MTRRHPSPPTPLLRRREGRDIARRLADLPTAEPPPELLDRLRADVPDDLAERLAARTAAPQSGRADGPGTGFAVPRSWIAAAAVLVTLVGGGWLAWQLASTAERPTAWVESRSADESPAAEGAVSEPASPQPASPKPASPQKSSLPKASPQTVAPPVASPPASFAESDVEEAVEEVQEAVPPPPPAPSSPTASPVPRLEARALPQPPPPRPVSSPEPEAGGEPASTAAARSAGIPTPEASVRGAATGHDRVTDSARRGSEDRPFAEEVAVVGKQPTLSTMSAGCATVDDRTRMPWLPPGCVPSAGEGEGGDASDGKRGPGRLRVRARLEDSRDPQLLPGATVVVEGDGVVRRAVADETGEAVFEDLPRGEYVVYGELPGFNTYVGEVELDRRRPDKAVVLPFTYGFLEEMIVVHDLAEYDATRPLTAEERTAAAESGEWLRKIGSLGPEADPLLDVPPPPRLPPSHFNPEVDALQDRLSTFGLDVDTGSWTVVRGWLREGRLPPPSAVRVEEVVNAQPFGDPFAVGPAQPDETFRVEVDGAPSPFVAPVPETASTTPPTVSPDSLRRLVRFRIAARPLSPAERRPVVLTLVVDVSGSMEGERLALVQRGVARLLAGLRPGDRAALVTFAEEARVEAVHGDPQGLREAVAGLEIRGGTNTGAGLTAGYRLARAAFDPAAANRLVLLSDGVANLGETTADALLERVRREAWEGIELTTVGVGLGDYGDELLERLADRGDGRYAYVDGPEEVERLFAEELDGTLQTVAEEARVQVEIDPRSVETWRLLGYENRAIPDREFRYDSVDGGEIGPGHSVTALYELKLRAEPPPGRPLALLKLRWRQPAGADGTAGPYREFERRLLPEDLAPTWDAAAAELRLAVTAAALAEALRGSPHAAPLATVEREARALAAALPAASPARAAAAELAELAARYGEVAATATSEAVP